MPNKINPGLQLVDGGLINLFISQGFSGTSGLTAHSGGGQASAVALPSGLNQVDTCAADHDSVKLPSAVANAANGLVAVLVYNNTTHTLDVYPQSGDSINNGAANAVFSVGAAKGCLFFCSKTAQWGTLLSA